MRAEIVDRLNDIIENDPLLQSGGSAIFNTFRDEYPNSLDDTKLSCVLWLPRSDNGYSNQASMIYNVDVSYLGYFYLQRYGMGLSTIQNIRALKLPDLVVRSLLKRPHLDYNDAGLGGSFGTVYRPISVRVQSDLLRPLRYPLTGGGDGSYYWGFIVSLTIPFSQNIELVQE